MDYRYEVITVRKSANGTTVDRSYKDEAEAHSYMDNLASDKDCLLAEIQRWPFVDSANVVRDDTHLEKLIILAQAERIDHEWKRVDGELLCRTTESDARKILHDNGITQA